MSESELRPANEEEAVASETVGAAIVAMLQGFEPQVALTVMCYVVASVFLDLEAKPPFTRVTAAKHWFETVVASIEANEAADRKGKH